MRRRSLLLAALPGAVMTSRGAWAGWQSSGGAANLAAAAEPALANAGPVPADRPADAWQRLALAWQVAPASAGDGGHRVGVLTIDEETGALLLQSQVGPPSRAHGLLALPDGGYVAVANRPGTWLMRCDAAGQLVQHLDADTETPARTFNGHVETSADGAWLFSTETDGNTGTGWVSVRSGVSLQRVAQFESAGIDPHHLLRAADGALMVANGGIPRDRQGRKLPGERMAPSLARINSDSGRLQGLWTLPDPQLSIRHMAWSLGAAPLLGLGLQAEHGAGPQRAAAPALAVWDGDRLTLPCDDAAAAGYVGDIAAGPGGGFLLSAQKQGLGLWWQPRQVQRLITVAELTQPCALVAWPCAEGVSICGARGLARWHAQRPPRMNAWPFALSPDNHAVALAPAGGVGRGA